MAVAFIDRQPLSRSKGHSTIAKAAYNACTRIGDEDYRKKSGLAYTQMITTDRSTPPDRTVFWQEVEATEKKGNAQVGYSYTGALPNELSPEQHIKLAEAYAEKICKRYDFRAVDLAIHYPQKRRKDADAKKENPHIHILTPSRTATGEKLRLYGDTEDLLAIRQLWQEEVNRALEEAGHTARIDVRSVEEQWAEVDDQITALEEKERELTHQLEATNKEIKNYERRAATPVDRKRLETVHGLARGQDHEKQRQYQGDQSGSNQTLHRPRRLIQGDQPSAGQTGSTAEQRRIASAGGDTQKAGRDRKRPGRSLQYATQAKRIASRLDGLRLQRTNQFITHKLTCLAAKIAARLEALRYERTAKHYEQQRDNQPQHSQNTLGSPC